MSEALVGRNQYDIARGQFVTPEPGVYPGTPYAVYASWDAARSSLLTKFDKSPMHVRHEMLNPRPDTAATALGEAMHTAILEPERFEKDYAVQPKFDRRKTADKQALAEWEAEHADCIAILQPEMDECLRARDAAWKHPIASSLLGGRGLNEASMLWEDPETGEACKLRLDRYSMLGGDTGIIDIKSARDASPGAFQRSAYNYRYHEQAGMYLDGVTVLRGVNARFFWIVIEKDPVAVVVYEPDVSMLEQGYQDYRRHLRMWHECRKTNRWPGYPETIQPIELPAWARRTYDLTDEEMIG